MLFKNKFSKFLSAFCVVIFIVLIIVFPEISSQGVSRGLLISANVIIPSLFPFMVCVLMLIKSGFSVKNGFVNNILYAIFGHNFDMFFVFLLSMLGGYPVGARLINEQHGQNIIDKKTADIMLTYCVNAGPAFVICAVGSGMLGSYKIGVILLFSHIVVSVILAAVCGIELRRHNCLYKAAPPTIKNFSENFVVSVADASASVLKICSFAILFSGLNAYLDYFFGDMPILKNIVYFTEVTSAVTKTKNIVFISFLLGFSGVSIWCQIFAISGGRKINFWRFCLGRILHGFISALITKLIINVFDIKISTFSNNIGFKNEVLYSDIAVSISLAIMLIMLFVFIYTKNSSGKIQKDVI